MKKVFMRLMRYVGEYRSQLLLSVLCALVSVACTLAAPIVIGRSVDAMAAAHAVRFSVVFHGLVLLAFLYLGNSLFLWLLTWLTNRISYNTANQLRRLLFDKLSVLPLSFFDGTSHGDTTSRFVNDVDIITDGMLQGSVSRDHRRSDSCDAFPESGHDADCSAVRARFLFYSQINHNEVAGDVPASGGRTREAERLRGRDYRRAEGCEGVLL